MQLQTIQNELIKSFDFDNTLDILEKLGENYTKTDLENIARDLVKLLYQSREMEDVYFSSGYLEATRSYIDGTEVNYNLSFSLEVSSSFSYELENSFRDEVDEKSIIKKELEELLKLNQNEYDKDDENYLAFTNISKIEKMLILLD